MSISSGAGAVLVKIASPLELIPLIRVALLIQIAILIAWAAPSPLAAQSIEVDGIELRLTGRLQVQYNTSSLARRAGAATTIPFSTFETRRVRLAANFALSDWITGEIEPEFALGQVTLKNAFIDLAFDPRFGLRVGQFKKPFSSLELVSSTKILPIERALRIRGLDESILAAIGSESSSDPFPILDGAPLLPEEQALLSALGHTGHDLGVEVYGRLGQFGYQAGAFNGNGANRRANPGDQAFVARLTYEPLPGRPLTLGAAASYREFIGERAAELGEAQRQSGKAFEIDATWGGFRRAGLQLMAEAALGDNLVEDGTFTGAQGIAAFFHPIAGSKVEGVEPLLRISYGDADRDRIGNEGWLLTPGLNLYFAGRNRLMVNWDIFTPGDEQFRGANAIRAQAQIFF